MVSPKVEPMKIQLVFQGGGAKLAALMAVAEVLREFENDGVISIGKAAGSSAGAIAAAMLSSSEGVHELKGRLKKIGPPWASQIRPLVAWDYWRLYRGDALYDQLVLEDFFRDLLCPSEELKVGKLRIPTEIYFTDLYSLDARTASADEPLPTALAKSCRVPLAFCGYASKDSHVDGGLALNLPADQLLKEESSSGRVIGISFNTRFADKSFTDLIGYTKQLFSAAIQASVNRSKLLIGAANVFSIETDIETFDFERALYVGLEDKYQIIKYQFRDWLNEWLKNAQPLIKPSARGPSRFIHPILNSVPLPSAIVRELQERTRSDVFTHGELISGYDTAILENGVFTGKYKSRVLKKLWIKKRTNILSFDFQAGQSAATFDDLKFGFMAVDNSGEPLTFVGHVQELTDQDQRLRSFRLYLLFDTALTPDSESQPYVVEVQYEIDDPFANLHKRDTLTLTGAQGGADEMVIGVAFPKHRVPPNFMVKDVAEVPESRHPEYNIVLFEGETIVPSERLQISELIDKFELSGAPDEYCIIGSRLKNAKHGDCFGIAWG
jgi:predicted acylesterase/phospholipase RssA